MKPYSEMTKEELLELKRDLSDSVPGSFRARI